MSLPNPNPSLESATNPYFQDNDFVRGVQMRNNNVAIWGNLTWLDWQSGSNKSIPTGSDQLGIADSAASGQYKYILWSQIITYLQGLFLQYSEATPVSYTPTFTGFGTATDIVARSWRIGSELFFEITFQCGTTTGTEARVSLGYNGTDGNVTSASDYPTAVLGLQFICMVGLNVDQGNYLAMIEASKGYLTFGVQVPGGFAGLNKRAGTVFSSNQIISLKGSVRIAGW